MANNRFNAQNAILPAYFQRLLLRILVDEGLRPENLLEGLQLTHADFVNDDCRITPLQNVRFIKNVLTATQNPHLGWQFGRQLQITTLGFLGYVLMSSENVSAAVETLTIFFKIRDPSFELKFFNAPSINDANMVEITEAYDFAEAHYFMLSCIASAFDHLFKELTKESKVIDRCELTCETPEYWGEQIKSVDFPVIFNAPANRLYLDRHLLEKKMPAADSETEKSMRKICQEILSSIENQSGIIKEVNKFIVARSNAYPSLEDAASHLCISPRTLRRELQKSNTTYQQLLDSIRSRVAKNLLLNTVKTTSQIAVELGYNDASNFSRAFKAWFGASPGRFRRSSGSMPCW